MRFHGVVFNIACGYALVGLGRIVPTEVQTSEDEVEILDTHRVPDEVRVVRVEELG